MIVIYSLRHWSNVDGVCAVLTHTCLMYSPALRFPQYRWPALAPQSASLGCHHLWSLSVQMETGSLLSLAVPLPVANFPRKKRYTFCIRVHLTWNTLQSSWQGYFTKNLFKHLLDMRKYVLLCISWLTKCRYLYQTN